MTFRACERLSCRRVRLSITADIADDGLMTGRADAGSDAAPAAPNSDEQLDLEFAYTSWQQSCRNLYSLDQVCRRQRGHAGEHAAGHGLARRRWRE